MRRINRVIMAAAFALLPGLVIGGGAVAETKIRIGYHADLNSLDPHFFLADPNLEVAHYLFSNLMTFDERSQLVPDLATSYEQVDPLTWVFRLRKDVRFSDGTPLTADDVAFSFKRAGEVPNSPGSFALLTRGKAVTALDSHTVQIKTARPDSATPIYSSLVPIVSRKHGEGTTTADYNAGRKLIGSGPYKFVEYLPGDRLVFTINKDFYGRKPPYDTVTIRWLTNSPARVAALLAGDVDLISSVPDTDIERLSKTKGITLGSTAAHRSIYLVPEQGHAVSSYAKANDGKPLPSNPFKDVRVRRAISKAIDRNLLVQRVLNDLGLPASQVVPPGFGGFAREIAVQPADVAGARQLLKEAGYPDGFALTLSCSSGRYPNSARVCQAIGQMLSRAGIKTEVQVEPINLFDKRRVGRDFGLLFYGTANPTGDMTLAMTGVLHTREANWGVFNQTGTGNQKFDRLTENMLAEMDRTKRSTLMEEASRIAVDEMMIIPLYHPKAAWAWREGFDYVPRMDEQTTVLGFAEKR